MKLPVDHPKIKPTQNPEVQHLARQVGKFVEYWGFKAIQGKIWCYLFLSRRPLNSRELAQLADVSPALVTQSIQVLLKYEVILEADKGQNGILQFVANPNAGAAVLKVLKSREAPLLSKIEKSVARLNSAQVVRTRSKSKSFELDLERSNQMAQWVQLASALLLGGMQLLSSESNPFSDPENFQDLGLIEENKLIVQS